jgi:hypothetical protein
MMYASVHADADVLINLHLMQVANAVLTHKACISAGHILLGRGSKRAVLTQTTFFHVIFPFMLHESRSSPRTEKSVSLGH